MFVTSLSKEINLHFWFHTGHEAWFPGWKFPVLDPSDNLPPHVDFSCSLHYVTDALGVRSACL